MKNGAPNDNLSGSVLFIVYKLPLQYFLICYNVSCHFYADNTPIYFRLDSEDQYVSKLIAVLNAVQKWIFQRKFKLYKDKTNKIVIGSPLQIRNLDLSSILKLVVQSETTLSTEFRNPGVALDKVQLSSIKIGGLMNIAKVKEVYRQAV